jgi:hypothetical protein
MEQTPRKFHLLINLNALKLKESQCLEEVGFINVVSKLTKLEYSNKVDCRFYSIYSGATKECFGENFFLTY